MTPPDDRPPAGSTFGSTASSTMGISETTSLARTSSNVDALPTSESTDDSELAPGVAAPTFNIASTTDPSVVEHRTDIASVDVPIRLRLDPPSVPRPNHRICGRPDDVCARCWDGLFAEAFGLRHTDVHDDAASWSGGLPVRYLARRALDLPNLKLRMAKAEGRINVTVGIIQSKSETGKRNEERETEELAVVVNRTRRFNVSMTADNPIAAWMKKWAGTVRVEPENALAWARACIEECTLEHSTCKEFSEWARPEASLPTRLIDCSDPLHPRLADTRGWDPMRVQYAALSYVWGGDQPNRTTVDNLSTYLEGIDLTLIPKTIADAIRVAHALGIQYLWADSLCIIQDSREDKHRELRKMRDVYRHAYLTIDAANAHSASEGFLCDSDRVPMHTSDWLPFAWSSRHQGHPARLAELLDIGREAELTSYKGFSGAGMLAVQTHGSTGLRAWCLQETLMSGRCVRFSSEALQFKCRHFHQLRKSDTAYDAILGTITAPNVLFQPSTAPSLGSADWLTIHAAWANVVLEYSWRFLSYPEDKLVACAGLAEAFGNALGPRTE
ncbi:hypothetical protein ONZ51_g10918 [Trametes cubensis]|uniref:Heterokaryon incompatibility domain-containing protein n=1 Tax=Trametes cubensis TaxID=1111947 RepID=A0AAD7X5V9_9APHY|nr:hypothetical protein ONZ51_g10918 [Trametes cubensis]